MSEVLSAWLDSVRKRCPEIKDVWLIGSRANDEERADSDWDFIAFGSEAIWHCLNKATELHREDVDFLVVKNGDDFQAAWGETDKGGSLSRWQWKQLSQTEAEYREAKWHTAEDGAGIRCRIRKAVRV